MLGTTLPTPLYPIYQQELGFGGLMVTVVFATYAVGVLAALLLFGRLSDRIGRRPVLLPGLALAAASSLVFLIPDSLPALFAGRVLSGLSAGVFTGVATATIVDLAPPEGRARAGLLAAAVNMLGLGLGPVVAGALADLAPLPLVLPYLVHLGLVAVGVVAVLLVPEPVTRQPGPVRLEVQRLSVPADVRPVFVRAGIAGFAGFAVLGFFTAVSPLFVSGVLREPSHLLSGLVVFSLLGSSTAGQLLSARLPLRTSLLGGCLALAAGIAVVGAGLATSSLAVLVAGAVVAGLGQGASFRAGLQSVTGTAPADRRSEVSSSFFLLLYVAISIPVIGVGAGAQVFGLVPTAIVFAGLVALLALAAFAGLLRRV
ncbi:MFS transporter [Pseudonocardia sp. KRD-184]|uniref:MFS transporter n=2 Tax=Pseudonocardia oceani TaxID=2792013 RepID=A0ABS6U7Z6_9PSEU|nr:MFS transporter [Pseudonocardia oceani]MBW0098057.1 MFS transporter [Pseudonocardia oceani]MBW0110388.1 MFS transporter [Pseudonocardia oceani]MBW0122030.1 MFS transporter [Pseudonocardia oceani]MBW0128330.1 MFS transporter [Pseudonocardia oceani]